MGWEQFEVYCVGFVEICVMVVVWVAIVLNENGPDTKGWFVFPFVVDQGDDADALDPEPKLSARLRLVIGGNVKSHGGYVNVCLQGLKDMGRSVDMGIGEGGVLLVQELVN